MVSQTVQTTGCPKFAKEWLRGCAPALHVSDICQLCHTPQTCGNEGKGVSRDILLIIMEKLTATPHKNLLMVLALPHEWW